MARIEERHPHRGFEAWLNLTIGPAQLAVTKTQPGAGSSARNAKRGMLKRMDKGEEAAKQRHLIQMIRRIAKEIAYEVVDEHLDDYQHKEKPAEEA